jgi:hypothetical protein
VEFLAFLGTAVLSNEHFSPLNVEYTAHIAQAGEYPPSSSWGYFSHMGAAPPPMVEMLGPNDFRSPPTASGIKLKFRVTGSAIPAVNGHYRKLPRTTGGKRQCVAPLLICTPPWLG